jgi:O-antigen ligase
LDENARAGVRIRTEERACVPLSTVRASAIAVFFLTIGCYTLLAPLQGRIPIGAAALPSSGALALAIAIVASGIIAAFSLAGALRDERLRASWPIVALWFAALAIPAIGSFLPARTWPFIGLAVLCCAVSLAIVRWWRTPGVARALIGTYLVGGLLLTIASLAMLATHRPASVYAVNLGRATGFFITPNQYAAWLVPFMATSAGFALATRSRARRILAGTCAISALLALALTFSFGGWLGGATAIVLGAWWLGRRAIAATAATALIAGALVALAFPSLTHHRAAERFVRLDAAQAGWHMATLFPLTGVGPLAFRAVYPLVRATDSTEDDVIAEHPHDLVLSLFAETGIAGTLAIGCGWWLAMTLIRRYAKNADERTRAALACIAAGLAGRFAHGLVDLVGVLELAFVWLPFAGLMLALARDGMCEDVA